ncbi:WNT5B [Cordylochernes scorpioides]|uniref:WNT5B n=1 Tax=Cordylochernes scorpioides TaxID=51811 RepID=A0ABY6KLT0_9ARAC|nr:WNT5B [Cordylochernes scorpioides]
MSSPPLETTTVPDQENGDSHDEPTVVDGAFDRNMPRRSRPLIGRNTAASRRYRNAIAIETPLQSETRRALRRLRYSEARVAAAQTMQVPVQRIQLWTHKPFSGLQYNTHIDYKADSSVDIGQMSRVCQFCSALRFRDEPFGLCCKQVSRIINEDLGLRAFKRRTGHLITPALRDIKRVRSKMLLAQHDGRWHERILFTDEKFFTVEEKINRQNDRIYARSSLEASLKVRRLEKVTILLLSWFGGELATKV